MNRGLCSRHPVRFGRSIGCRTRSYRLSRPVRFEFRGWCVARRGDYRVTFRAFRALRALEDDRVLYIGRVEHRAHVYRRR
jgi:mRNA interferase RelE/StbE